MHFHAHRDPLCAKFLLGAHKWKQGVAELSSNLVTLISSMENNIQKRTQMKFFTMIMEQTVYFMSDFFYTV